MTANPPNDEHRWKWPDKYPHGFDANGGVPTTLDVGDTIDRIAPGTSTGGSFAAPPGTSFPEKGLPPDRLDPNWTTTEYEVVKTLPNDVLEGVTESAFGQKGGGVQYYFPNGVQWYVKKGYIDVVS
jgi:hypothetical protein